MGSCEGICQACCFSLLAKWCVQRGYLFLCRVEVTAHVVLLYKCLLIAVSCVICGSVLGSRVISLKGLGFRV